VNEIFLRVAVLRAVAPNVPNSPVVGMTHFWVMVLFALLGAYFNIRYRRGGSRIEPARFIANRSQNERHGGTKAAESWGLYSVRFGRRTTRGSRHSPSSRDDLPAVY
jgi:hypothetical protein